MTSADKLTPMMKQYRDAKARTPGCLLFFRMGDFYELFEEDAVTAARELDLTLTSRDKGENGMPMAGVPHHSVHGYLQRLLEKGYKVALCDQLEDPRQAKGVVQRGVTRIITPGVNLEPDSRETREPQYLAAVVLGKTPAVAVLDVQSGDCAAGEMGDSGVVRDELLRLAVREVLAAPGDMDALRSMMSGAEGVCLTPLREFDLDAGRGRRSLLRALGASTLEAWGMDGYSSGLAAIDGLFEYIRLTQQKEVRQITRLRRMEQRDHLVLDDNTLRNLDILRNNQTGRRQGSLLGVVDQCRTSMGGRLLAQWLAFPLNELKAIHERQSAVAELVSNDSLRDGLDQALTGMGDLHRVISRISMGLANPRDLLALGRGLDRIPAISALAAGAMSRLLAGMNLRIQDFPEMRGELAAALSPEAPLALTEGGIFNRGWNTELDELISLSISSKDALAAIEARERERTGIASLKVRYNRVFGYYIEISSANLSRAPADYIRKQTLTNAERFITPELKDFEDKVLSAEERRMSLEYRLFTELRDRVAMHSRALQLTADALAELDALVSLAAAARKYDWRRPEVDESGVLEIHEGRHPVIEAMMKGERFVPNDVVLDVNDRQILLVTGPNMAGKSTVMRQAALIAVLAHVGSFVPAAMARVGLCDRVFTRVGASDNLVRGRSTFMTEMIETASILLNATRKSLVILDEIGRGTSTFDGLSIAWAVAEYLHDRVGCRTLFATHYHELTELCESRERMFACTIAVREVDDDIVFLRKVVPGGSNRSYGIHVARLAGVPPQVTSRAREILGELETGEYNAGGRPRLESPADPPGPAAQLSLFVPVPIHSSIEEELRALDLDSLTPMEALNILSRWRKKLGK
ncbi:MAG: DNA mismatch repair protein MutS [Myxococcota bacterium]|nr:DNA mismatch repair protein MutS [Myxococcota bacterium]